MWYQPRERDKFCFILGCTRGIHFNHKHFSSISTLFFFSFLPLFLFALLISIWFSFWCVQWNLHFFTEHFAANINSTRTLKSLFYGWDCFFASSYFENVIFFFAQHNFQFYSFVVGFFSRICSCIRAHQFIHESFACLQYKSNLNNFIQSIFVLPSPDDLGSENIISIQGLQQI